VLEHYLHLLTGGVVVSAPKERFRLQLIVAPIQVMQSRNRRSFPLLPAPPAQLPPEARKSATTAPDNIDTPDDRIVSLTRMSAPL